MTIYYKATRLSGESFHAGADLINPLWKVGGKVTVAKPLYGRELCGPGVLHAATVPTETLVGGSWPCRLFEVTGRPLPLDYTKHPHKRGFATLRVIRELPAWQAFGPQGQDVVEIIDRAERLTAAEVDRIRAAWTAAGDAAWTAAWNEAGHAAWAAARDAAWATARDVARAIARDVAQNTAWAAARNAASATVARDLITADQYEVLMAPWRAGVGRP